MALTQRLPFHARALDVSPWFWPVREPWSALAGGERFPGAAELSALYAARRLRAPDLPALAFVEVPKLKPRRPRGPIDFAALYEGRIAERGEVPQRPDDWHDLFNALAFMVFPRAKIALHLRQYTILRGRVAPTDTRLPGARTREQDTLSLFDEGGVIVLARPDVAATLDVNGDDCSGAVASACRAGDALLIPFGHALHEHLVLGLPCPLAMPHVLCAAADLRAPDPLLLSQVDLALAKNLADPAYFRVPPRCKGLLLPGLPCREPAAGTRAPSP